VASGLHCFDCPALYVVATVSLESGQMVCASFRPTTVPCIACMCSNAASWWSHGSRHGMHVDATCCEAGRCTYNPETKTVQHCLEVCVVNLLVC
jgi:hypothetical protein